MLLVGLTGGLASGKSTVARLLTERGAVVVDADELSRRAVAPGSPQLDRIVETFGPEVLAADGSLDRAALARVAFGDETRRRQLEAILHPEVFRLLGEAVAVHRETGHVVVFDAPLIFETGFDEACDLVVAVGANEATRVQRVMRDRGMDEGDARSRIAAQAPEAERLARADIVIENDGSLEDLERRVDELWGQLSRRAAGA